MTMASPETLFPHIREVRTAKTRPGGFKYMLSSDAPDSEKSQFEEYMNAFSAFLKAFWSGANDPYYTWRGTVIDRETGEDCGEPNPEEEMNEDAGPYKRKPAAWITLENGEHVPLDKSGKAIGGAGGYAKGRNFSYAMTREKTAKWKSQGWEPELGEAATKKRLSADVETQKTAVNDIRGYLAVAIADERERVKALKNASTEVDIWRQHVEESKKMLQTQKNKLERYNDNRTDDELQQRSNELLDQMREHEEWFKEYDKRREEYRQLGPEEQEARREERERDIEERKKKLAEQTALEDEYYKLHDVVDARRDVARAEDRIERYERSLKQKEKELGKLENPKDPGAIDRLTDEYETAAKTRDDTVLRRIPDLKSCETVDDVTDYMRAKNYFAGEVSDEFTGEVRSRNKFESDKMNSYEWMTPEYAKGVAGRIESIMADYPGLVGKLTGVRCDYPDGGEIGYHSRKNGGVCLSNSFFSNKEKMEATWKKCLDEGFHPPGTTPESVVDHELTHAIEHFLNESGKWERPVADLVMEEVQRRMGGSYLQDRENAFRKEISKYAYENTGVTPISDTIFSGNGIYGRNTEWLAEGMQEARASKNPRRQAKIIREVFEEFMREGGLI